MHARPVPLLATSEWRPVFRWQNVVNRAVTYEVRAVRRLVKSRSSAKLELIYTSHSQPLHQPPRYAYSIDQLP
jgi:hypothetical protein